MSTVPTTDLGSYVEHEGRPAVRFVRTYPHPVERVWRAVSDPAELAHWFPSAVTVEPREGGRITFSDDPYTEGAQRRRPGVGAAAPARLHLVRRRAAPHPRVRRTAAAG